MEIFLVAGVWVLFSLGWDWFHVLGSLLVLELGAVFVFVLGWGGPLFLLVGCLVCEACVGLGCLVGLSYGYGLSYVSGLGLLV